MDSNIRVSTWIVGQIACLKQRGRALKSAPLAIEARLNVFFLRAALCTVAPQCVHLCGTEMREQSSRYYMRTSSLPLTCCEGMDES
ncbi:hypothetical protein TELCIR_14181 [Teladorsagia circumcincta]|uniref:Uncharacterized protein n=1 Tax=Teladorsagia circumcincta TaxID=45464 RepID=A0A2G9U221_TELCI|nr:hypothetical protein TELCIR_14181 [Teladorsagia circumcincta]